jgi:hypothetical protein
MNKRGKAIDLAHWLRRHPKDPRNAYVAELLDAAERLEERLDAHDLEGATDKADALERVLRKVDELYLVPFLQKAQEFSGGKKTTSAITQAIDDALKLLGVNASTHEIKRQVSKSPVVRFEDTDGSLWTGSISMARSARSHITASKIA